MIFVEVFHKSPDGTITIQRRKNVTDYSIEERDEIVCVFTEELDSYERELRGVRVVEVNR